MGILIGPAQLPHRLDMPLFQKRQTRITEIACGLEHAIFRTGLLTHTLSHTHTHTLSLTLSTRFRCVRCSTIFCAQCRAVPYHMGKTCREASGGDGVQFVPLSLPLFFSLFQSPTLYLSTSRSLSHSIHLHTYSLPYIRQLLSFLRPRSAPRPPLSPKKQSPSVSQGSGRKSV